MNLRNEGPRPSGAALVVKTNYDDSIANRTCCSVTGSGSGIHLSDLEDISGCAAVSGRTRNVYLD